MYAVIDTKKQTGKRLGKIVSKHRALSYAIQSCRSIHKQIVWEDENPFDIKLSTIWHVPKAKQVGKFLRFADESIEPLSPEEYIRFKILMGKDLALYTA
jgi:hypothetical protein